MGLSNKEDDVLLGITDTADELDLSKTRTRYLIDTGRLRAMRTRNGRRLVRLKDARAFARMRRRRRRSAAPRATAQAA